MKNTKQIMRQIKALLFCPQPGHEQQSIDYICLNEQCAQSSAISCYMCRHDQKHEMTCLKIIISQILQVEDISDVSLKSSASIDMKLGEILNFLQLNQKEFINYSDIITAFQQYSNKVKNQALKHFIIQQDLIKIPRKTTHQFQKQLSNFLIKNKQYIEVDQKQKEKKVSLHENILIKINEELEEISNNIKKLKDKNKCDDYSVLLLFPIVQEITKVFKVRFDESLKGDCMTVELSKAEMTKSGQQRVVGMQPCLDSSLKKKKWKLLIKQCASWVGVGACHIKKVKEQNWNFKYSNINHGTYYISSNGYSWSSYQKQKNSKFESFSFKTGDIIILQYNPRERILKFSKEDTEQTYSLEIEANGDPLHPSVNLTGIGDCVEVLY